MNSPEFIILCELLDHDPDFVSGTALARKLGMSRVGVWMHMEKLRAQGFEFEALRNHGYRIRRPPAELNPLLVQAYLKPRRQPLDLLWLPEIDSTNAEAERQLAAARPTPFVVLARRQSLGRGRFGRVWHSAGHGNLYASFVFRPRLEPGRMSTFTLWMGANLCDLVANFCSLQPGLKWPNDLYFGGRKFGGMLTEARIDADQIRDLVFGLGLNVNHSARFAAVISHTVVQRVSPPAPASRSTSTASPPRSSAACSRPTNSSSMANIAIRSPTFGTALISCEATP